MQEKLHIVKQVLQGNRLIENKQKFMLLGLIAGSMHIFIAFMFASVQIIPLLQYNLVIAVMYLGLTYASVKKEKYVTLYYFSLFEIIVHSCVATFFIGMNKGFLVYILAYIPGSYYLENNLVDNKDSVKSATLMAIISSICYLVFSCIAGGKIPAYESNFTVGSQRFFYTFNVFMGLGYLLLFSFLFAIEIRYANVLLKEENSKLGIAANQDALTGVLNRRGMTINLKNIIENSDGREKPFCLIMADIDLFKHVNDTFGHDVGDVVLREIARIFRENIREDDVICRWGGEEFLLMINADIHIAEMIADRIRVIIGEREFNVKKEKFNVTVTMGIAEYQKGMQLRTMIELADQKLYYGKNHGRNQIVK